MNKNEIVAIDFHNHSMKVDGAGRVPLQVWLPQEGNGRFNAPTGVAVDSSSSTLVADQGSAAPRRCTALGPSCPRIKSAEPSQHPRSLALTSDAPVVVAAYAGVNENNQLTIYNRNRRVFLSQTEDCSFKTASQITEELFQRSMVFSSFICCQNKEH